MNRAEQVFAALRFDLLLPAWLLVGLAVLCALLLGLALWRRARGVLWRAACFVLLLAWLAGPRLVQEDWKTLPDIALLVVDQSASMQVGERASLAAQAQEEIQAQVARLPEIDLQTITVPESGNGGTKLFGAMERALSNIPRGRLAGVIAITDGQAHDVPAAVPGGAPLHVLVPARGEETDRRLRLIEAPGFGIVGKSVTLRVAVDDLGVARPAAQARLSIRRDGELARTEMVPIGQEYRIAVPIVRAGPIVLDLQVEKLAGEVSAINNRAVVEINGVRDRLRVLLVSGEPHSGARTWRRLLKADPAVDLVHFTILRPPEKDDMTPLNELALIAFPVRELFQVKLPEFDLVILDRFQNRGLLPMNYYANIAEHVKNGGALLISVGPEFVGATSLANTPLAPALSGRSFGAGVVAGAFRPRVTALGARHPVTAALEGANDPARAESEAAWGSWYRRVHAEQVTGEVVLATPDGSPLLVLERMGQGRAALLLSDQIWLWLRGHQGGGPQAELLRRVAHWLMQQPELEENALIARAEPGGLRIERRSIAEGPAPDLRVTDPEGRVSVLTMTETAPGRATASVMARALGVWQVSDGARNAFAAVGAANPLELADLRAAAGVLAGPARASGGGVHFLVENGRAVVPQLRRTEIGRDASGGNWIGLQRRHDHVVTGITALSLLPPWAALPLILGCAVLAWWHEGA
ncbi:MAG: hypothetical protein EXR09_01760 [Acetobacteraceae bacterium]|nr:hypothetical protein [Acetobacteraceae bacterium]